MTPEEHGILDGLNDRNGEREASECTFKQQELLFSLQKQGLVSLRWVITVDGVRELNK